MTEREIYLLREDFKEFPCGAFPYDREHSAMGEYHLCRLEGFTGVWNDPVCNYSYSGPSWMIVEKEGRRLIEQQRVENTYPHRTHPILMAGEPQWRDYTMEADIRPYNTSGSVGLAVCAQNSLRLLAVVLERQRVTVYRRHKQEETVLASAPFPFDSDRFYRMKLVLTGELLQVYVDGKPVLEVKDKAAAEGGRVGLTADRPAAYGEIWVTVEPQTADAVRRQKEAEEAGQRREAQSYPSMKLLRTIDLKNFGTGRQIRFGHLRSPREWNIVLAQCQKRVYQDAYAMISCLTAIDLEGNVLWQWGEPSERAEAGLLSADLPFQVYDINGDGRDEVIFARDFELLVLDGVTGRVLNRTRTPHTPEPAQELLGIPYGRYAFDRLNPDCIRICNVSGKERPSDILIKDRYSRIYVLDSEFRLLWKYHDHKNTGHFPYPHDFNGDGRDEIFCGYNMLSADGELLWTLPLQDDHTDEIVIGKFRGDGRGYLALASGSDGFVIADLQGRIVFRDDVGHAQRISVGSYLGEPGKFGICLVNYWGHQGIIYFYDCDGKLLWEKETGLNGQVLTPVNWKGDGTELILVNADCEKGGLMDGRGNLVVSFPRDGHPDLCAEAIDLFGDNRDELVVWDQKQMYIYTQADGPVQSGYEPVRYPLYAMSNYRGEYSYPDSSYVTFEEKIMF